MRPRSTPFDYFMAIVVGVIGVTLQLLIMGCFALWDFTRWVRGRELTSERVRDWTRND